MISTAHRIRSTDGIDGKDAVGLYLDGIAKTALLTAEEEVILAKRIERMKADEAGMRQTIGALITATDTAERAIAGLKETLGDCDRTLAERLRTAERYAADLAAQVEAGQIVMERIGQIVSAARKRMASDEGLGHLIVYPEGTRTRPGEHRPYKHGIATIHLETGLPVYPVAVNCGLFWPKRGIPVASGRAVIEFLPPMRAHPGEDRDAFITRLRDAIETRSDALMAEAGFTQPR